MTTPAACESPARPPIPPRQGGPEGGDCIVKSTTRTSTRFTISRSPGKAKPGQTVKLKVKRGEETVDVEATLVERK
jgi:S1-C subfamily serine protease